MAFFHRPSRPLVLTDLVVNLEAGKLPLRARLRLGDRRARARRESAGLPTFKRRAAAAREAARRLVALDPERVIFAHGRWFDRDGAVQLRRSFGWLLR